MSPSVWPSSNDDFGTPSLPAVVPLGETGDQSATTTTPRTHPQHHQDLGDALEALEAGVAIIGHDHSATGARATVKLAQTNTHQSPDTDTSPTSLHHTLGTGANQMSFGNHSHNGTNSVTIPISGVTGLQATLDAKLDISAYTPPTTITAGTFVMLAGM